MASNASLSSEGSAGSVSSVEPPGPVAVISVPHALTASTSEAKRAVHRLICMSPFDSLLVVSRRASLQILVEIVGDGALVGEDLADAGGDLVGVHGPSVVDHHRVGKRAAALRVDVARSGPESTVGGDRRRGSRTRSSTWPSAAIGRAGRS